MKILINFMIFFVVIFSCYNCNKASEKDLIGVYKGDKVSTEFSGSDYRYLVLEGNNKFYLKYLDIEKKGITGSWKLLDSKKDTLNVQFHFSNKNVIGKIKGNTFLFEKPNVFDQRFPSWLYVKTNLERHKIIK